MGKVYIFGGFVLVLFLAAVGVVILSRLTVAMFRAKKKEKVIEEPPEGARWHRPVDGGPGYWV
jgi:hypothetical protein